MFSIRQIRAAAVAFAVFTSMSAHATNPVDFALGVARDSVNFGLGVARDSVELGSDIAYRAVSMLTTRDRDDLRDYCNNDMRPYESRYRRRLPRDWEEQVYVSGEVPPFVFNAGIRVPRSAPGLRRQPKNAAAFRIEDSVILIDTRSRVVVDVITL